MRRQFRTVGLLLLLAACSQPSAPPSQNTAPVAVFSVTANGLTVSVDGTASVDPDGSIVNHTWSFGDGSSLTGATVEHTYAASGSFLVTLTVTDNGGSQGSSQQTVTVSAAASPTKGTVQGSIGLQPNGTRAAEFRDGELIVRFATSGLQALSTDLQAAGLNVQLASTMALPSTGVYVNRALDREQTLQLAQALEARPDVVYAVPNPVLKPFLTPNDEYYDYQWHYPAMNLPAAWDITTGSPDSVVAVVDTGILWDENPAVYSHPDLADKVLPGYDFITEVTVAGDGDGRDPNPYDIGDNETPDVPPSFHGTHVAGTVAAATNNNTGVAGVDWQAKILPVRVLGIGGGAGSDIYEGMLWAAGVTIPGIPQNPNPARVINMSLGGPGQCTGPVLDAVNLALAQGAILVVAAGNEKQDMTNTYPANCPGVITVGAVDLPGNRAHYSNFGSGIDVMAPGGDVQANVNGDILPDGVLSTGYADAEGYFEYGVQQGTSMAAPHVAGLVSLMLSLDPTLSAGQVRHALRTSAVPMTVAACATLGPASNCGTGRVDALAALQLVQAGDIPEPDPDPQPVGPSGSLNVRAVKDNGDGSFALLGEVSFASPVASYSFDADPGDAYVLAWTDEDGSGSLTVGDYYGEYPSQVAITAGSTNSGIDIQLIRVAQINSSGVQASLNR